MCRSVRVGSAAARRLIGLLCAIAPALAAAQVDAVEIYGRLYPEITAVRTSGETRAGVALSTLSGAATGVSLSRRELAASDSWMGIRGGENLGSGYRAVFQIEGVVGVDNGTGGFANRNTHVGLVSPYGTVLMGNIDTVYKTLGDTLSFLGVGARNHVTHIGLMTRVGFGTNISSSFHLRQPNSVRYASPNLRGFQFMAQYSPDESKTATRKADLHSVGLSYRKEGLYLALAHEVHNDFFAGSLNARPALSNSANPDARSKDSSTRLTARYAHGATTVEFDYALKEYKERGGALGRFASYRNRAWLTTVQHVVGKVTLAASYVSADDGRCTLVGAVACGTAGLGAQQFNLGASYSLSKRTALFAIASLVKNEEAAQFSNLSSGAPARGADIKQASIGIRHNF